MIKKFLIISIILLSAISFLNAEERIAKPYDMMWCGGTGVASYGKMGMVFYNPASVKVDRDYWKFGLLNAGLALDGNIVNQGLNVYNDIAENQSADGSISEEKIAELIMANNDLFGYILNLKTQFGIQGPLQLGWVGKGVTVLFYDDFRMNLGLNWTPLLPYADVRAVGDAGLILGYAFTLPVPDIIYDYVGKDTDLYGGVSIKPTVRSFSGTANFGLVELYNYSQAPYTDYAIVIDSDIGVILKRGYFGIGDLSVGVTLKDWLPTYGNYNRVTIDPESGEYAINELTNTASYPASFDLGASYVIPTVINGWFIEDFGVYADIHDLFNINEHFFSKIHIGTDLKLFKVFRIALGLNGGYPTGGFGIHLPLLKVSFSGYTEELGSFPGSDPQTIYRLDAELMVF